MKILKKIIRMIFTGLLIIILLGVSVFITAGLMPVKDKSGAINKSCYVEMKDGTRLAVRYSLPADLKEDEKIPAVIETTRYVTENQRSFILRAMLNLKIAREVSDGVKEAFIHSKYAFVRVDARGSGSSFGAMTMEFSRELIDDMDQVIDWIISRHHHPVEDQPWR
jgi:predicted acyl esterase